MPGNVLVPIDEKGGPFMPGSNIVLHKFVWKLHGLLLKKAFAMVVQVDNTIRVRLSVANSRATSDFKGIDKNTSHNWFDKIYNNLWFRVGNAQISGLIYIVTIPKHLFVHLNKTQTTNEENLLKIGYTSHGDMQVRL